MKEETAFGNSEQTQTHEGNSEPHVSPHKRQSELVHFSEAFQRNTKFIQPFWMLQSLGDKQDLFFFGRLHRKSGGVCGWGR